MLVISLAVMGSISQSKTYRRKSQKSPRKVTAEGHHRRSLRKVVGKMRSNQNSFLIQML